MAGLKKTAWRTVTLLCLFLLWPYTPRAEEAAPWRMRAARTSELTILKESIASTESAPKGLLFRLRRGLRAGIHACKTGKQAQGLQMLDRVIRMSRRWMVRPLLLRGLFWKGYYLERRKDLIPAAEAYREAVAVFEDLRERWKEELAEDKVPLVYKRLVALLVELGRVDEALAYLRRSRSKALQGQFSRLSVAFADGDKGGAVAEARRLEAAVVSSEEKLHQALSKPGMELNRSAIEGLQEDLSHKQRAYTNFIYELKKNRPELSSLFRIDPKDLRTQRERIPRGVVLIEYLMGEEQLYLFLVSSRNLLVKTAPITARVLSAKIDFLLSLVSDHLAARSLGPLDPTSLSPDGVGGYSGETATSFLEVATELYDLLLGPFSEILQEAQTVAIIPNGRLHSLPFEVLGEIREGAFRPVIGQWPVCYLYSLDVLTAAVADWQPRPAAFANADGSLPQSEKEVMYLKGIYPHTFIYTGKAATETLVKAAPSLDRNLIHLATHGRLLLSDMRRSFIQLAPDTAGRQDGRLTLEEVWGMNLGGTGLVVLSACDTGVGEQAVRGEVVSPASAFLEAGTRRIISTLWRVPDTSTAKLMKHFYQNLNRGMDTARALQVAKQRLAADPQTAWPFYWAPFILTGDWR